MKLILTLLIAVSFMPAYAAPQDCLSRSKDLFNEKDYPLAESTLKKCIKGKPADGDAFISLAGVQMILGKFNDAKVNFLEALKILGPSSPYSAYINSRLGDIAMRNANLQEASFYYDTALRYEPANINALVGKGICEEKAGRVPQAVAFFRKALAVDFTNIVARERIISMEPEILSEEEVLLAMKERNIIDPASNGFTPEDRALLKKMYLAEKDSGIEYLSAKYKGKIPAGYIVERDSGKIYVRKMLTLTGYNELITQLSGDAKQLFLDKGIVPGTIFKLRDFDNKFLFDNQGNLTEEGLVAYTKILRGTKAYLLPNENLPGSQSEIDALAKKYIAQGYSEISMPEYLYLMRHTRCSEQTLVNDLRVKVINLDARRKRIFVVSGNNATVPFILPYQYVVSFRESYHNAKKNNQPVYATAFGTGRKDDVKLCKQDGSLWSMRDVK